MHETRRFDIIKVLKIALWGKEPRSRKDSSCLKQNLQKMI